MKLVRALIVVLLLIVGGFAALVWLRPDTAVTVIQSAERARAGLSTGTVSVDGTDYYYLSGGSGPPLVLIHGFGADGYNWIRTAPYLTDRYTLYVPDLPGFGDTPGGVDMSYTIGDQSQRVFAFMDALGLNRAHLGGSSMGGYIAAVMARLAPQRVQSLWLLAPGGVMSGEMSEMFERVLADDKDNPLIPKSPADFQKTLDFVFEKPPYIPGPIKQEFGAQMIANQPVAEKVFADIRYHSRPLEQWLDAPVDVPALIVWGDKDRVLHPSGADIVGGLLPASTVMRYDGVGHLPMLEVPQRAAEDYLTWQASRPGGS